tara:strand:- start:811 stop:984 length:174 start_codon:yes stop_codon:yes gene_type:complete
MKSDFNFRDRCHISLSDSFTYKELKNRIRDENGTIGNWIRLQKKRLSYIYLNGNRSR